METDKELADIVTDLRNTAEYVMMLVDTPGSKRGYRTESGQWVTRPSSDNWALAGDTTVEGLCEASYELAQQAGALQDWLDDHGPEALKNPHRYPEGWTDDGRFVQLRGERRSWLRRFLSSRRIRPAVRKPAG